MKNGLRLLAAALCGCALMAAAIPAFAESGATETRPAVTEQAETERPAKGERPAKPSDTEGTETHGGRHRGRHSKPAEPEAPENAIGKDAAKEAALEDAGLTAEQVEKLRSRLSDKNDTLVYRVSFRYEGMKYSYKLDPLTGEVIEKKTSEAGESHYGGHRHKSETQTDGTTTES